MLKRLGALAIAFAVAACGGHSTTAPTPPDLPARADNAAPATQPVAPPPVAPAAPVQSVPTVPMAQARNTAPAAREAIAGAMADAYAPAMRAMPAPPMTLMARPKPYPQQLPGPDRERYGAIDENGVQQVAQAPVSTFSIDVDTGSYSNVRRLLNAGRLPPADAVRVEEMVNYFPYDYAQPRDGRPFAVHADAAPAPWQARNVLLRIGIKAADAARDSLPPANLVFLVDVSGSMYSPDKLPLLKSSLKLLTNALRAQDRITLVTYASGTRVVLPPTSGSDKATISSAIDSLAAGGSTAGASGIALAYQAAQQSFIAGGINRVLLATDGDFNVGITDLRQLKALVAEKRKSGVSLSTLGFGTGNYNDQMMEQLADAGDGAYSYIDNLMEGQKVLVEEFSSTLATVARDVKIQVEFNPATVKEYRLIGYENRALRREDFNNDQVDAGDIGAGHTVTALYELTLAGQPGLIEPLRYQPASPAAQPDKGTAGELAHIKLRYKLPQAQASELIDLTVQDSAVRPLAQADDALRFAAAVAGFGQILRGGNHVNGWTYADARTLALGARGTDRFGYRGEFIKLVDLAQALSTRAPLAQSGEPAREPPR
ncbi:VWA domain-containing protein [Cupriavidus basilensis]|uniref:von Willebrand factor type A domain protein n=1 Tax=Cupriavidus basilensis TaxID=68895 RepID=A0A0C4Y0U9_9BURK|nr:VWA domain-containing protein [Cupriavidus basilensis]AJG18592.1 Von Willebrand factor type A domain protein [Cupriavidus basilensis]